MVEMVSLQQRLSLGLRKGHEASGSDYRRRRPGQQRRQNVLFQIVLFLLVHVSA